MKNTVLGHSSSFNASVLNLLRRRSVPRAAGALAIALGLLAVAGCGMGGPQTVPVSGVVTYKSEPLPSGTVRFNPVDAKDGRMAEGRIDSEGKFVLSTFKEGDGALPGEYKITVVSMVDGPNVPEKDRGMGFGDTSAIPEKYNSPKTSELSESVVLGQPKTDLQIELSD